MSTPRSGESANLHLRLALGLVLVYLCLGLVLELGLALRWRSLGADTIAREFIRLGHVHGGIAAMLNLGLATAQLRLVLPTHWRGAVALCGSCGAAAIGGGFLGGALFHGRFDPGPLVLLVPAGALCLICAVLAVLMLGRPGASSPGGS